MNSKAIDQYSHAMH